MAVQIEKGGDICRKICMAADELESSWLSSRFKADRKNPGTLRGSRRRVLHTVLRLTSNGKPEGITLTQLSTALRISPGDASTAVDELVKKGYLNRRVAESDRRCVTISVAELGEQYVEEVSRYFAKQVADFTRRRSSETAGAFEKILDDFLLFMSKNRERK